MAEIYWLSVEIYLLQSICLFSQTKTGFDDLNIFIQIVHQCSFLIPFFRMDQAMRDYTSISPPPPQSEVSHFKGQLFYGCANILIKRAVKDEGSWRDVSKLVGLLYLGAYSCQIMPQWTGKLGINDIFIFIWIVSLAEIPIIF